MLKHKMKQWLSDHQPDTLRSCGVKAQPSSPRSMTPPLLLDSPSTTSGGKNDDSTRKISSSSVTEVERSPSNSAVNMYPSLKSKILGPKMGAPSSPLSNTNSMKENTLNGIGATASANGASSLGRSFSSTTDLAAAAAQATGLAFHSKRKREDSPTKPSPIKVVRVKEDYNFDGAKPATTNGGSRYSSKPSNGGVSSKPYTSNGVGFNSRDSGAVTVTVVKEDEKEEGLNSMEETDDDIARRLHQELNCAPVRHSRSRRNVSCAQETMAEDPVHGQDPGILPSC